MLTMTFLWIQTVTATNENGVCETFTDPKNNIAEGYWPIYLSDNDLTNVDVFRIPTGADDYFPDEPARRERPFPQSFEAELSLVGVDQNNQYIPLATFRYGFSVEPGTNAINLYPLRLVSMYPNSLQNLSSHQLGNIIGANVLY